MLQHYRAIPRGETQDQQIDQWFICNDSILTDRDRADVPSVVDRWMTSWNVSADVSLADEHTIAARKCG
jgi:hypothetical protein